MMMTSIYASILGLMLVALSINVIKTRRKVGAALGTRDDMDMIRSSRAQANLAEYAPIFLILLGFAEFNGLYGWAVHALGLTFVAGRILHAYSLLKAEKYEGDKLVVKPVWRIYGMMCTFNTIGFLAIVVLVQSLLRGF